MTELRFAEVSDIDTVALIIEQAREFLKNQGHDQWQNGYPNKETVRDDVKSRRGFVVTVDGNIAAYLYISLDGEPVYEHITDGEWHSDVRAAVIHRVAISNLYRGTGLSSKIFSLACNYCKENGFDAVRIDTHPKNMIMQHVLEKNGFERRGRVFYKESGERLAFEKIL